jgi:WhiB family redox-sensing transcriptional regulator
MATLLQSALYENAPPAVLHGGICHDKPKELFYPEVGTDARKAKEVCRACPVRIECLEYAIENGEKWGIWGGTSHRERQAIKRARARYGTDAVAVSPPKGAQRPSDRKPGADPVKPPPRPRHHQFTDEQRARGVAATPAEARRKGGLALTTEQRRAAGRKGGLARAAAARQAKAAFVHSVNTRVAS